MSKVWQKFSEEKESEEIENKRCNRKSINSEGGVYKTFLNALIAKLKSKKIIVILCLVSVTFLIIPVIPILKSCKVGSILVFLIPSNFENFPTSFSKSDPGGTAKVNQRLNSCLGGF